MIVSIKNLVKRYDQVIALNHLNLEVEQGDILGLIGPNGSGKTTALHCIIGLLSYDKGTLKVFDEPMYGNSYDLKAKIGVVFQDVAVIPELTVYENLSYFCSLYISDNEKVKVLVEEILGRLQLRDSRDSYPNKLSVGLVRRLHIACGMVHKPELIIFDEPTVGVDPESRLLILNEIKKANQEGATIIYATHYMEEIEAICTKVVVLLKGRIASVGTIEELKRKVTLGEKILVEVYSLEEDKLNRLKELPFIYHVNYENNKLSIQAKRGKNNLIHLIQFLNEEDVTFGEILASQPTLNDVYLEVTKGVSLQGGNDVF